jgi:membrane fusion protein (multidrug efflux system)
MEYTTAREQYAATVNQMREAYQGLQAQRARVAMARRALADTAVRAPLAGLVAEKHVTVGQFVQRGTRVATVVRVDPLRVELAVPEAAAAAVRRGQRVSFAVQTYPDRRFEGTVAHVGPSLRAEARALVVEALVPNRGRVLQPGLFATARIELPATAPSAYVPASAVRGDAGAARLFVVREGRAEMRVVQVGAAVDGWVEIARGVRPGEQVVTDPVDRLTDGAAIAVAAGPRGR